MRWVGLLKAVNVGGNRKLPMADLRAFMTAQGYGNPKTVLAAGNVAFDSTETDPAVLEHALERAAQGELGFSTEWLVRDAADLDAIIAANPFADAARMRASHLIVIFHRDRFDPALLERLDGYTGPERLIAAGRELFVDYPAGIGESKLIPAMKKAGFPALATARNWNTVQKLRVALG